MLLYCPISAFHLGNNELRGGFSRRDEQWDLMSERRCRVRFHMGLVPLKRLTDHRSQGAKMNCVTSTLVQTSFPLLGHQRKDVLS